MLQLLKSFFRWRHKALPESIEKKEWADVLAAGANQSFWKVLRSFIEISANTDNLLRLTDESKFMYMKGYIQGQRDIVRLVESAESKKRNFR